MDEGRRSANQYRGNTYIKDKMVNEENKIMKKLIGIAKRIDGGVCGWDGANRAGSYI